MTTPDPLTEKLKDKIKFELKHSSAISLTPATEPDFDVCLDKAIVQILHAFEESNWKEDKPKITDATLYPLIWAKSHGMLTGAEYYRCFKAELKQELADKVYQRYRHDIERAAKRAAGVSDE